MVKLVWLTSETQILIVPFCDLFDFHVYDPVFLGSLLGGDQILAIAIFDFDIPAGVLKVSKSRRPWAKAAYVLNRNCVFFAYPMVI